MNRDLPPLPSRERVGVRGRRERADSPAAAPPTGNVTAPPHPSAARPPSPARGEGNAAATLAQTLKGRARAMRKEPTEAERKLWHLVRGRRFSGFKFRRQLAIGRYIADLVCLERRLIVEADGGQHAESTYDATRDAWLAEQGFRIRRFWNSDVVHKPDEVSDTLWADLTQELPLRPVRSFQPMLEGGQL